MINENLFFFSKRCSGNGGSFYIEYEIGPIPIYGKSFFAKNEKII